MLPDCGIFSFKMFTKKITNNYFHLIAECRSLVKAKTTFRNFWHMYLHWKLGLILAKLVISDIKCKSSMQWLGIQIPERCEFASAVSGCFIIFGVHFRSKYRRNIPRKLLFTQSGTKKKTFCKQFNLKASATGNENYRFYSKNTIN